jgi:hypothetical protein
MSTVPTNGRHQTAASQVSCVRWWCGREGSDGGLPARSPFGLLGRPGLGGLRGEPAVDLRVRQAIWHRTSAFVVRPLVTVAIPAAWQK